MRGGEIIVSLLLIAMSIWAWLETNNFEPESGMVETLGPAIFPRILLGGIAIGSVMIILQAWHSHNTDTVSFGPWFKIPLATAFMLFQALAFEEQYSAPEAEQTATFARDDALQAGREVPSAFPGSDFFLTEVQAQLLFTGSFLEEFLTTSFYREHHAQNFDDKIFEHEPLNKFFDLLRVKLLVWQAMRRMRHKQSPLTLSAKRQKDLEQQILAKLAELHGSDTSSLKQSSVKTE